MVPVSDDIRAEVRFPVKTWKSAFPPGEIPPKKQQVDFRAGCAKKKTWYLMAYLKCGLLNSKKALFKSQRKNRAGKRKTQTSS
jgi:hypothetical protein